MTTGIEIHDSILKSWLVVSERIDLFLHAYVHTSEGKAGVDEGTGWTQAAVLRLFTSYIQGELPDSNAVICDGRLRRDAEISPNWIPIPFDFRGDVELELQFVAYPPISIHALGLQVELIGPALRVENFS